MGGEPPVVPTSGTLPVSPQTPCAWIMLRAGSTRPEITGFCLGILFYKCCTYCIADEVESVPIGRKNRCTISDCFVVNQWFLITNSVAQESDKKCIQLNKIILFCKTIYIMYMFEI